MENGFKKAAHTADVDMEFCIAFLGSFIVTVVSKMNTTVSLISHFVDCLGFRLTV